MTQKDDGNGEKNVTKKISDATKGMQDSAKKAFGEVGDAAKENFESAEELIGKGVKRTVDLIGKHPVESALVCFGIGCLIGAWLKGRR